MSGIRGGMRNSISLTYPGNNLCSNGSCAGRNRGLVLVCESFSAGRDHALLLLSLITLFAGPLLYLWLQDHRLLADKVERVLVGFLLLIVVALLAPEMFEVLSWTAPALMVIGYLLPGMLEKLIQRAAKTLHLASLVAAAMGLLLHALLDGAGLAGSKLQGSLGLALVIVLHRFGVGMILWMVMRPAFGQRVAWLTLGGVAAATIIGYEFSARLLPLAGDTGIAAFQAVVIGTIVHSLVHREHVHEH